METDQYLDMFLDESREHLQAVNDHILELEKQPDNIDLVNEIFRSAHTLKGMAATMGFEDIASLTHKMENVLDGIRNYKLNVTTEVIDVIFVAIEYLENMVDSIAAGNDGKKDVSDLVARLDMIEKGKSIKNEGVQEVAATLEAGTPTELQLDQFQLEIVQQAKELGINAYQLTVSLEDECILKGARAYMVFDVMEKNGDIIKTNPAVEDIEEGNFEDSFSFVYVSSEPPKNIQEQVSKVSEVKNVEIVRFVVDNNSSQQQKQTEEKVEKKVKK